MQNLELFVFKIKVKEDLISFALPIEEIVGIQDITNKTIEQMPDVTNSYIKGVMHLRDELYTVVDMNDYLYQGVSNSTTCLLVTINGVKLALLIDEVQGLIEVPEDKKIEVSLILKDCKIKYHIYYNDTIISVLGIDV